MDYQLTSEMVPKGDQPQAIEALTARILEGKKHSTLLGVTGSGKTFTMAHVIQNVKKPTLIMSHNQGEAKGPHPSHRRQGEQPKGLRGEGLRGLRCPNRES